MYVSVPKVISSRPWRRSWVHCLKGRNYLVREARGNFFWVNLQPCIKSSKCKRDSICTQVLILAADKLTAASSLNWMYQTTFSSCTCICTDWLIWKGWAVGHHYPSSWMMKLGKMITMEGLASRWEVMCGALIGVAINKSQPVIMSQWSKFTTLFDNLKSP